MLLKGNVYKGLIGIGGRVWGRIKRWDVVEKLHQWAGRCPFPFLFFISEFPSAICSFPSLASLALLYAQLPSVLPFCLCFPMSCCSQNTFSKPFSLTYPSCPFKGFLHTANVSLLPPTPFIVIPLHFSFLNHLCSFPCLHGPAVRGSCSGVPCRQGPTVTCVHIFIYTCACRQVECMYFCHAVYEIYCMYISDSTLELINPSLGIRWILGALVTAADELTASVRGFRLKDTTELLQCLFPIFLSCPETAYDVAGQSRGHGLVYLSTNMGQDPCNPAALAAECSTSTKSVKWIWQSRIWQHSLSWWTLSASDTDCSPTPPSGLSVFTLASTLCSHATAEISLLRTASKTSFQHVCWRPVCPGALYLELYLWKPHVINLYLRWLHVFTVCRCRWVLGIDSMRNYIYGHSLRRNGLHILSLQISPILIYFFIFLITLPVLSKVSFYKVKLLKASKAKTLHGGPFCRTWATSFHCLLQVWRLIIFVLWKHSFQKGLWLSLSKTLDVRRLRDVGVTASLGSLFQWLSPSRVIYA